jgi:hypothetical protein
MKATLGSSRRRRQRLRTSNGSGRVVTRPVTSATPIVLTAIPSRRKRLSDGVLVEASVLGRLLGVRILTLRASVVLAPAEVTAASSAHHDLVVRAAARSSPVVPTRRPSVAGHGLAEAVRRIDEGAELLAEARRNGL